MEWIKEIIQVYAAAAVTVDMAVNNKEHFLGPRACFYAVAKRNIFDSARHQSPFRLPKVGYSTGCNIGKPL